MDNILLIMIYIIIICNNMLFLYLQYFTIYAIIVLQLCNDKLGSNLLQQTIHNNTKKNSKIS